MSPAEHDKLVAGASHVPHLVAAALVAATPQESLPLVAGGWIDTTRIAAGDPELWRDILLVEPGQRAGGAGRCRRAAGGIPPGARATTTRRRWSRHFETRNGLAMLWEVDIYPADGQPDRAAARLAAEAAELELADATRRHGGARLS